MNDNQTNSKQLTILVVDDHQLILKGTILTIKEQYPQAKVISAQTAQETLEVVSIYHPDVVILDLSLPEKPGMSAQIDTGINLLQNLMNQDSTLNITVQSSWVNALVRLKHDIDNHQGGFTIADKSLSTSDMLKMLDWSIQGITHTKMLKTNLEFKPEWLEVLDLAFKQGLQDKAIAARMYKSLRMIRNYWTKIQDALEVYPEENQNIRALTLIRAKEEGLID
jgi:DNA-binding NarL/FixJ family response regulator